jgi:hypothetical protein
MQHSMTEEEKKKFAGIYLLEFMVNNPKDFKVFLDKDDQDLEKVLEWLATEGDIIIRKEKLSPLEKEGGLLKWFKKEPVDNRIAEQFYSVSPQGEAKLKNFLVRYSDYLHYFDIFSMVDLEKGEFAFSEYPNQTESIWQAYTQKERWDDLRIAVCTYLKISAIEVVFMSFVQEKRFGRNQSGWQFDLLLGSVWDEIIEICDSAIQLSELAYEVDDGFIEANSVMEDVLGQGAEILESLHLHEDYLEVSLPAKESHNQPRITLPEPSGHYKERFLSGQPFWE